MSFKVKELAFEHMNEPTHVQTEPEQMTGHRIVEELFYPQSDQKFLLLLSLIEDDWPDKAIIFANTKHVCEKIYNWMKADKHRVGLLTGDVNQRKRLSILDAFAKGDLDFLVATDVAARGLHIPAVTHVYNFDLPDDREDYVHRIGRTGRAGASGEAVSLVSRDDFKRLCAIERRLGHIIERKQIEGFTATKEVPVSVLNFVKNNTGRQPSRPEFKKTNQRPTKSQPKKNHQSSNNKTRKPSDESNWDQWIRRD